jgi:predicted  nucleic acid-binding Zn-ribbon protein
MGLGTALSLGGGALGMVALAVWLVFSYRDNAKLEAALALAQIDEASLRDKLAAVTADYQRATAEAKEQAARDTARIAAGAAQLAAIQTELEQAIQNAAEHGIAPANLAAALSRAKKAVAS